MFLLALESGSLIDPNKISCILQHKENKKFYAFIGYALDEKYAIPVTNADIKAIETALHEDAEDTQAKLNALTDIAEHLEYFENLARRYSRKHGL